MKNLEALKLAIQKMEIVTVASASEQFDLAREEVICFVQNNPQLRIYDELEKRWINENVDGHC
jgi:hypothetical protein